MISISDECLNTFAITLVVLIITTHFVLPKFKSEGFNAVNLNNPEIPNEIENQARGQVDNTNMILSTGPDYMKSDLQSPTASPPATIPENYYFLDDGVGGKMSIQHNLCSPSCCSEQYPTPFKMKYDPYVCKNKDKFVPSQIFCNNSFQDAGCLCMTKEQSEYIYNRGGNGRDWF